MIVFWSKAKMVIKIDIVNPIPANMPTPKMCFQRIAYGNEENFKVTAVKQNNKIPNGLPTINPNIIPKLLLVFKLLAQLASITTDVFAKANKGKIKNATDKCKKC